jgi:hypothetical protein
VITQQLTGYSYNPITEPSNSARSGSFHGQPIRTRINGNIRTLASIPAFARIRRRAAKQLFLCFAPWRLCGKQSESLPSAAAIDWRNLYA